LPKKNDNRLISPIEKKRRRGLWIYLCVLKTLTEYIGQEKDLKKLILEIAITAKLRKRKEKTIEQCCFYFYGGLLVLGKNYFSSMLMLTR
jgi:hypothetical protein